jgi:hypothetical protein
MPHAKKNWILLETFNRYAWLKMIVRLNKPSGSF